MKNINSLRLRKLFAFFVFLFASVGLMAQANFAGTWGFNESKSNFGESQFRFAATTMIVTQDDKSLSVESTMPGRDGGEMKMTAKYNLDGTVSENTGMMDSKSKSTVTWSADKTSITIATTMTFNMNGESREMKSSQTWKLSDGGKLLLIDNVRPNRDGVEMKTTVAYDKK
jgi:hypothetical protein